MSAGMYIVAVCALGGLIASLAFWWAVRSGQLTDAAEAKWLVFDDGEELERARKGEAAAHRGADARTYRRIVSPDEDP